MRWIYRRKKPQSVIVTARPAFKTRWQHWLLANSITLTPGTITLECDGEKLVVHGLDESMAEGLEGSAMERGVEALDSKH